MDGPQRPDEQRDRPAAAELDDAQIVARLFAWVFLATLFTIASSFATDRS